MGKRSTVAGVVVETDLRGGDGAHAEGLPQRFRADYAKAPLPCLAIELSRTTTG